MILYILFALVVQLYLFLRELTSYDGIYCVSMQWNFNMKYIVSDKLQKLGFYYIDEVNRLNLDNWLNFKLDKYFINRAIFFLPFNFWD